ncbi:TPA: derepression protein [Salmonella enterica subsp. salamae serovar 21:z10:[z6]]|nr:derepression protein [Salmonella enterica subsp. salamae]
MANRKRAHTRADVKRIHTQTEIDRRLFRAHTIARAMHINILCDDVGDISPYYIAAVFSYLADDLRSMQKLAGTPEK